MTGNLLDTNVAILALGRPELLSQRVREALTAGPNWLSVAAYWEVVIKSMRGRLDIGDPIQWWSDALADLMASPLAIRSSHVAAVCGLPPIHQDPFDRILIAQAIAEDLVLLTVDQQVLEYQPGHFRAIW